MRRGRRSSPSSPPRPSRRSTVAIAKQAQATLERQKASLDRAMIDHGDPARTYLLDYKEVVRGHVDPLARGIVVSNAQPGTSGLATVDPVSTRERPAREPAAERRRAGADGGLARAFSPGS